MKRLSYFVILFCYCTLFLHAADEAFLNKREKAYMNEHAIMNVYIEPDVYFYSYTYDNYLNGYAIKYLRLWARKLDISLNFVTNISRQEAKKRLSEGTLDIALFPVFDNMDDGLQLSQFPVGILRPALLIPKIYQLPPSLDSMEKLRITTVKGDAFLPIIKAKYPDADVLIADTIDEAVSKVQQQEVDVAIGLHEIFSSHLEYKMLSSLESIPLRNNADFPIVKLFLGTAKENILLMSIIDKTMAEIDYKGLVFLRNQFFPTNTFRQTNITVPLSQEEKFFLMGKQLLNVCTIPHSLPYGDISRNRYYGMGADIVRLLEKSLDIPIQLIPTNSREESLQKLLTKKCDFVSLETQTMLHDPKISFTSPLLNVPLVVVTTNEVLHVFDFKTIMNRPFVILKDHPMIPSLKEAFPSLLLTEVDFELDGLKLVEEGEYYGFITSSFTVSHLFQKHISDSLKVSAQIPLEMPFGFALLKENHILWSILEKASTAVLKNETNHLIKKWVLERSPKGFDYMIILEFVIVFIIFSAIAFHLYFETTIQNLRLQEATKSLDTLNHELESRIKEEVEVSREKDMLMYRQSRFASMGEMIGNIAHQWRQPLMELSALLMGIQASIHFKATVPKDEVTATIDSSNRVIAFMSHTIDDFRNFFSTQKELGAFCINDVVSDAVNIINATLLHHHITLKVITHIPNALAYGLKNEYAQVIINLISNSKDMLIIRNIQEGKIYIEIDETAEYSKVSVLDNAGGIEDADLPKIFEPFFTKKKTNGTGVGLFMCRMIIENNMKGIITAGNVDNGVAFCIMVPKSKKSV